MFDWFLVLTDAIGLAAFMVIGVLVCLIVKAEPLWLWGPFFAFLTGAGGGMMRDIVVKEKKVAAINGHLYAETAVFWGSVLSFYLYFTVHDVNLAKLKNAVILAVVSCFITQVLIYLFNIHNIYLNKPRNTPE